MDTLITREQYDALEALVRRFGADRRMTFHLANGTAYSASAGPFMFVAEHEARPIGVTFEHAGGSSSHVVAPSGLTRPTGGLAEPDWTFELAGDRDELEAGEIAAAIVDGLIAQLGREAVLELHGELVTLPTTSAGHPPIIAELLTRLERAYVSAGHSMKRPV